MLPEYLATISHFDKNAGKFDLLVDIPRVSIQPRLGGIGHIAAAQSRYLRALLEARRLVENGLMKSIRYVIPAIMLCATGLLQAQVAIGGVGNSSCDVWIKARKAPAGLAMETITEAMMTSWVQGYLSSKNSTGTTVKMVLEVPDPTSIKVVLDRGCALMPDALIFAVADDLANTLTAMYQSQKRK